MKNLEMNQLKIRDLVVNQKICTFLFFLCRPGKNPTHV